MPALNFTKELAPLVESGEKRQTIRAPRKQPIKPGDTLYFYTGMRTKKCRKLGEARCRVVERIDIGADAEIRVGNKPLLSHEYDLLAEDDGFWGFEAFLDFFRRFYGLPFEGVLIRW